MKDKYNAVKIIGVLSVMGLCFVVAYYLANFVFKRIGAPIPLVAYLFTCFLAFVILSAGMQILRLILKAMTGKAHEMRHNDILAAMIKISQGDFNVFVDVKSSGMHYELAEGINEMAQKLGSLESLRQDFISNVSHEIQSPLTSICGFASLLKKEDLSLDEHSRYINIIETESKRLSKLSDNLLKLSTLESEKSDLALQKFRLDKQIENIILLLEPQWSEKNINLDISLSKVTMMGAQDLLNQVWMNLIHNSIKFTPNEGTIQVMLSNENNAVRCDITDTGIGIPEDCLPHIFERFYKADKSRDRSLGGNGLGLAIAKTIVTMHGGQITVKSESEKGTVFRVIIPNRDTEV